MMVISDARHHCLLQINKLNMDGHDNMYYETHYGLETGCRPNNQTIFP